MALFVGRLLIAVLFIVSGVWKITHFAVTTAYFTRVGMPAAEAMAVIAILVELGGGLMLAVGWRVRWVAWLLALFVIVATGVGHRFWEVDPAQYFNQLNHFLKNLAVIGGLVILGSLGKTRP